MCKLLYANNTNIDYFPTNFVVQNETLYYIDYECNDYMEAYLLTAVTAVIFIMSGLLQVKTLLLTAGVVYLIGQLYVTNKYVKSKMQ